MKLWLTGIMIIITSECFAQSNADTVNTLSIQDIKAGFRLAEQPSHVDLKTVPANYATKHMAFFCKQELKLEKMTSIPILIRVGSVADCNHLEQKPGYNIR